MDITHKTEQRKVPSERGVEERRIGVVRIDGLEVFSSTNTAFSGVWAKGAKARLAGEPDEPPYVEKTTGYKNGVTFTRAIIKTWHAGWAEVDRRLGDGAA